MEKNREHVHEGKVQVKSPDVTGRVFSSVFTSVEKMSLEASDVQTDEDCEELVSLSSTCPYVLMSTRFKAGLY